MFGRKSKKPSGRSPVLVAGGAGGLWLLVWSVTGGLGEVGAVLDELAALADVLVIGVPVVLGLGLVLWVVWRALPPSRATRVLTRVLQLEGERPKLRRISKRGPVWRLAWKMPVGATVADLRARLNAFEEGLDCSASPWRDRGLLWVELGTKRLPDVLDYGSFRAQSAAEVEKMALPIPLGESRMGRLWADLAELPHLLVGGTTGGGKSVFLRQLLVHLVTRYGPKLLRLVLVDLKGGMELVTFAALPHLLVPVATEVEDCEIAFGLVGEEIDRRMAMFTAAGVKKLAQWNATHPGDELPWLVVVVDEFGELRAADAPSRSPERGRRDAVHAQLGKAGRLSRAVGVHLVICTQRPDADTVTPQVRALLPATVALRCVTDSNSRVLLGNSAAADLPPHPGRAIWHWDRQIEVQLPLLEDAEAARLLAARDESFKQPLLGAGESQEDQADAA